ncbi:hypothetical protein M4951_13330 [Blastopirellula sp. J2-11]|uniref:sodium:solute symporter family transporter n=1 Tax=Blastopirellula sp. J2-11 TaxID=2943192 RepID=UPI0021C6AF3D|nr:hypothetical protein [Blastopirellula sp. J2-11]UUO04376.1 hypothetical protein M4951_13330 [Blastopirellula sp. J2-11]
MQRLELSGVGVDVIDIVIVVGYLLLTMAIGLGLSGRASKNLDSYFLGGRTLPWWLLGLSGTACYFDVAGVMWMIGIFYVMGQQFVWPQFMWGCVPMLACFATFMGKWLRRSGARTGAEWMAIRFGEDWGGETARSAYAVMAVVIAIAFTGFSEYGCGTFFSVFWPAPASLDGTLAGQYWPHVLAIGLMALTAVYTIASGMVGVGFTGLAQFIIMIFGSTVLIIQAIRLGSYEQIAAEVPPAWFQFTPAWNWPRLGEWELTSAWVALAPITLTWVVKGMALGMGGPQQLYDLQRFLAAKSPREASLAGMIWGAGLVPMFMVAAAVGVFGLVQWGGRIENPEQLYPVVIGTVLPAGLKGVVLAGLLSAFMSTFSATVNAGASYLTLDIYKKYFDPHASDRRIIYVSRLFSLAIVVAGITVGVAADDINAIFEWIMMVLGIGVLAPNILRWFWWRFNGFGFAVGTLCGVIVAILFSFIAPDAPAHLRFFVLLTVSTVSSILAALCTEPTERSVLIDFYRKVRPAGFWGPVREAVDRQNAAFQESFAWDLFAAAVTAVAFQSLYLISTYAVAHMWTSAAIALATLAGSVVVLYFVWYRRLPAVDEEEETENRHAIEVQAANGFSLQEDPK